MILRPTSSTRTDTLFPSTTLFRPLSRLAKPWSARCRQIFGFGSAAQRARDQAVQTRMNRIARRDDLAAFNGAIPAPEIADESACFAHQKDTGGDIPKLQRSEEHTSELQSLMRISYAVFCLTKKSNVYRPQPCLYTSQHP